MLRSTPVSHSHLHLQLKSRNPTTPTMSSTSHVPNINPTNMDRTPVLVSHTELRLYHNGVASEGVRLSFDGESIVVNKTVLTNASEVFAAAFNGNFSNTATQEYTIEGYRKSTVLELLNHIYDTNTDFGIIWWESLDNAVKKMLATI